MRNFFSVLAKPLSLMSSRDCPNSLTVTKISIGIGTGGGGGGGGAAGASPHTTIICWGPEKHLTPPITCLNLHNVQLLVTHGKISNLNT